MKMRSNRPRSAMRAISCTWLKSWKLVIAPGWRQPATWLPVPRMNSPRCICRFMEPSLPVPSQETQQLMCHRHGWGRATARGVISALKWRAPSPDAGRRLTLGCHLVLCLQREIAGVMAFVQLVGGIALEAVDDAPALDRRTLANDVGPALD